MSYLDPSKETPCIVVLLSALNWPLYWHLFIWFSFFGSKQWQIL